jgi:tight adherence protein C
VFGVTSPSVLQQNEQLRIKRRQRAEAKAQQIPVKIVFPLILACCPRCSSSSSAARSHRNSILNA